MVKSFSQKSEIYVCKAYKVENHSWIGDTPVVMDGQNWNVWVNYVETLEFMINGLQLMLMIIMFLLIIIPRNWTVPSCHIYGAVIMASHCKSSPGSFHECRLSTKWPTNLQAKLTSLFCESACMLLPSTSTITIYYYLVRKSILIFHHTEGGRLSLLRHCSKCMQPVPNAVYRNGSLDKHNCPHCCSVSTEKVLC